MHVMIMVASRDAFMYVSVFPSAGVEPARLRSPFAVPAGLLESRHAGHVAGSEAPCCRHVLAGPIQHFLLVRHCAVVPLQVGGNNK